VTSPLTPERRKEIEAEIARLRSESILCEQDATCIRLVPISDSAILEASRRAEYFRSKADALAAQLERSK
jgi:hypothetical protein